MGVGVGTTYANADEAEAFGYALLRAARETRAKAVEGCGSIGTFRKVDPAPSLCDDCPHQALCLFNRVGNCREGGKQ